MRIVATRGACAPGTQRVDEDVSPMYTRLGRDKMAERSEGGSILSVGRNKLNTVLEG